MRAKWKGRAAKGQAGWGWRTLRKPGPLCSGLPYVMVGPLVAMVGISHHLQANFLLMPACQKGLAKPFRGFCSLTSSIWCLVCQSSSVMVGLYHQYIRSRRDSRKPMVFTAHSHPHLPMKKMRSRERKPPTQSHRVGNVEGGVQAHSGDLRPPQLQHVHVSPQPHPALPLIHTLKAEVSDYLKEIIAPVRKEGYIYEHQGVVGQRSEGG